MRYVISSGRPNHMTIKNSMCDKSSHHEPFILFLVELLLLLLLAKINARIYSKTVQVNKYARTQRRARSDNWHNEHCGICCCCCCRRRSRRRLTHNCTVSIAPSIQLTLSGSSGFRSVWAHQPYANSKCVLTAWYCERVGTKYQRSKHEPNGKSLHSWALLVNKVRHTVWFVEQ